MILAEKKNRYATWKSQCFIPKPPGIDQTNSVPFPNSLRQKLIPQGARLLHGGYEPWLYTLHGLSQFSQFHLFQSTRLSRHRDLLSGFQPSFKWLPGTEPKRFPGPTSLLPLCITLGSTAHWREIWGGNDSWSLCGSLENYKRIWVYFQTHGGFPKMVVPPNHPF